jgi:VCBS repeat protein
MLCDASAASCTDIHQFGSAQLTTAGTAKFRFVPGIGSHRYKAVFAGTPGSSPAYAASSSATVTLTVTGSGAKATTTTTLAVTGDAAGQYVMTATVEGIVKRPGLAASTGSVSFLNTTGAGAVFGTSVVGMASIGVNLINSGNLPLAIASNLIATADFNGDGFPDLMVAENYYDSGSALLNVLLENADGSFTPVTTPIPGLNPTWLTVGDYNGDGIPDLAVASFDSYTVSILLGNGDGTFRVVPSSIPITAQDMVTGDFNGDGIADLATAEGYAVSIFLGNGDGTFKAAQKNSWPEVNPLFLATDDFNGDGFTDLAVSDTAVRGSVFLLLNKGDGTFSKTGLTPATGIFVGGIAAGDLNGDGILDLALADGVTVLLGKGDGTFQAPKLYGVSTQGSVVIGDFNGDGIPDLAAGGGALLLGNGDGTFGDAIIGDANELGSGYLATADFNGDGFADMALPGSEVNVLFAQPTVSVTATLPSVQLTKPGSYQMQAKYSGDTLYQSSASAVDNVTFRFTPTVTASPSASSVQSPDPLTVAVVVTGVKSYPVPTGVVNVTNATLYSSGYVSDYVLLNHGSASIPIVTSALHIGTNALTVNYLPDATSQSIYEGQTGLLRS